MSEDIKVEAPIVEVKVDSFRPYKGHIAVEVNPLEYAPKFGLEVDPKAKESLRDDYLKSGAALKVVAVGEGCDWATIGMMVVVGNFGGMQKVTLEGRDEPVIVIREASLLGEVY